MTRPLHFAFLLLLALLMTACEQRTQPDSDTHSDRATADLHRVAAEGDTVLVHYTGQLPDGAIFESTADGQARPVTIGSNDILSPLEQALIGMKVGDLKNLTIQAADAFGEYHEDQGTLTKPDRLSLTPIPDVQADKDLQFEITLVEFQAP